VWEADFAPEIREVARKTSVSIVGRLLERPIQEKEYRRAFSTLAQEGADALIVDDEAENYTHRTLIIELAEKGRLQSRSTVR
jgi:putative ABC transport system substrate-binding protein